MEIWSVDPQYWGHDANKARDEEFVYESQSNEGNLPPIGQRLRRGFHFADFILFAALLLSSLGIGIYHAIRGNKTPKEYLTGDRKLSVIPVSFSIFMSFISAILVLGNTAEMYNWGTQGWLQVFGSSLAYLTVVFIFIPLFYPMNLTSSFEYLEKRFQHKAVKIVGTIYLMISQILYMGIAMFAPATALEAVTGFPVWASILASGAVATIYTVIGGMKAVIWTDVVQGLIYLAGVIVVLSLGAARVGGMSEVWRIAYDGGRIRFFNFDANPAGSRMSFFSVIVGTFVGSMQTMGTGQTSVQRYCALQSIHKARIAVLLNLPALFVMYTITCLLGLTVYAYYAKLQCDPIRAGYIENPNQLLPFFVMDVARYPGIPGIFLAVLFSGALSTLSSSLGALSAVTWKMIEWNKNVRNNMSDSRKTAITKALALGYGILGIGMAFLAQGLGGHVMQASQSFVSGVAGPLLGMYILGGFFPWANWIGAIVGSICGLALTMWIAIGSYATRPYSSDLNFTIAGCPVGNMSTTPYPISTTWSPTVETSPDEVNPLMALYKMSYLWYSAIGMGTTVVVGLLVSLCTGPMDPKKMDPSLFIPFFDRLFCYIPLRVRRPCWCGVPVDKLGEKDNKVAPMDVVEMKVAQNGEIETKVAPDEIIDPQETKIKKEDTNHTVNGYTNEKENLTLRERTNNTKIN